MTCPSEDKWALLSMNLLEPWQASMLQEHLAGCQSCRTLFTQARRDQAAVARTYEAFDRDHDELRDQLMASLPEEVPQRARGGILLRTTRRLGESIMTNPRIRYTAATLSAAACLAFVLVVLFGPSQSLALNKIGQAVQQTRTIVANLSITVAGEPMPMSMTGKTYLSEQHGSRTDLYMGGQLISTTIQPVDGPAVSGKPGEAVGFRVEYDDPSIRDPADFRPDAYIEKLRGLTGTARAELGGQVIDGQDALGFEIDGAALGLVGPAASDAEIALTQNTSLELWINEETFLPIRYTVTIPGAAEGSLMTLVCDQFQWDVELEVSLFDTSIFEEGEEPKINIKVPIATEEALITGLRSYSQLIEGKYPSALNFTRIGMDFYRMASGADEEQKEKVRGLGEPQALMDKLMPLYAGTLFFQGMVREGVEAEYFGPEVVPGDAEAVLVRWRLDTGDWRVIYGDLHVATVSAGNE